MPVKTAQTVSFYICEGCGPDSLTQKLNNASERLNNAGFDVQVCKPICMSACKFGGVVKVRTQDGQLRCYSNRAENGFQKLSDDAFTHLLGDHVPVEFHHCLEED